MTTPAPPSQSFNVSVPDVKAASLSQTFRVAVPDGVSGMYATRLDLFFKSKSDTFGIELTLVEVTNGVPDMSKIVPHSTVVVASEMINTSQNGAAPTTFYFIQPVFLGSDSRYAFVIRALGGSSDYTIWTGINGDVDIQSGLTISSNPLSETAYFAKSGQTWASLPNEDLKYRLFRARFINDVNATATFRKSPFELLRLSNIKVASGIPDMRAGDEVYGRTATGLANTSIYAKVRQFDDINNILYLSDSTGNFTLGTNITIVRSDVEASHMKQVPWAAGIIAIATVSELHRFTTDSVVPKLGNMSNSLTGISFQYRGSYLSGNTSVKETQWTPVLNHEEHDFSDKQRYVICHSEEVSSLSGNSCFDVQALMTSNSNFATPIIDTKESSLVALRNLISANTVGENSNFGNYNERRARYISKVVTLDDGQEAEDLNMWITAYKPPHTNVLAYVKVWNAEDSDDFDTKPWTQLVQITSASVLSDPKNTEDYREYQFGFPTTNTDPGDGTAWLPTDGVTAVSYSTPGGGSFNNYKKFAVKLLLTIDDPNLTYMYPRVNDCRAIALQR